jgi:hypothetical protein
LPRHPMNQPCSRRLVRTLLAPVLLAIAACQTGPPTAKELLAADYGSPITQEEAEAKAGAWLGTVLKDPDSLRASWEPVEKGWQRDFGGDLYFGYRMAAGINAKNGFGGYTGAKAYVFMFFNGALAHAWKPTDGGMFMTKVK